MRQARSARQPKSPALPDEPTMGDRLRFARVSAELSLEAVGEALGITGSAVSQWETGKTYPSRKSLVQFAELTSFAVVWLESGSVSVRTRNESILSHNSAMVPLITPSQAADEGNLRAFLGELYLKFSAALASGANHKATADRPHIVNTMFSCSMTGGFALEVFDRRNATDYEIGDIVVLDAEIVAVPGDMVFAAVDVEKRPVFAKYLPRGQHIVLKPLNPDWGDEVIGPGYLEGRVVAVMTERTHRRRTRNSQE
jgi:transcriptional regulator with XRE-family HTH domain